MAKIIVISFLSERERQPSNRKENSQALEARECSAGHSRTWDCPFPRVEYLTLCSTLALCCNLPQMNDLN